MIYQITAPTAEPLSLTEAKKHLNVTHTDDDEYIAALISTTRAQVEDEECGGLQLITGTYQEKLDAFSSPIVIHRAPLLTVSSITYVDGDGVEQTYGSSPLTEYAADLKSPHLPEFGEIHLAYGATWPAIRSEHNAVRVRFTCGFGPNALSVPRPIKQWMLLAIGNMYAHRETQFVGTIISSELNFAAGLLNPYRVRRPRVA